jgi:hypothetical protein
MKPIKLTKRSQVNPKAGKVRGLWKKKSPKRKPVRDRGFLDWFAENKNSESLQDSWQNAVMDCKDVGEKPPTFRQWAKEVYDHTGD